ncbi:hypothetical protein ACJIZ3_017930 [Penstemon smallii]|uniref:Uncharacterized protein n=1 Tax=Penstemon smallii TaxID=265156 RepID=A0ABD3SY76_9LAMI
MVEFSFLFCWKRPNSSFNSTSSSQELTNSVRISQENEDLEMGNKDLGSNKGYGEGGVEAELMRMHNLCGPPRFLFTIKEESKEDLESEDGKSKGERIDGNGTPFLTPLSSPISVRTPNSLDSYNNHGFNPLFESLSEAELNRLRSSPPPKFKFLKDAEDKVLKNEDCEIKDSRNEEKEGSFVSFLNTTKSKSLASQPRGLKFHLFWMK